MGYGSVESQGYVSIYGDTMKGPINMGGNAITGLPAATENTQPVRLAEFNSFISGTVTKFAVGAVTGQGNYNLGFKPKVVLGAFFSLANPTCLVEIGNSSSDTGITITDNGFQNSNRYLRSYIAFA